MGGTGRPPSRWPPPQLATVSAVRVAGRAARRRRLACPWGLAPLADQQLAGVIMWIPAGLVYLAAALTLMATWILAAEREAIPR